MEAVEQAVTVVEFPALALKGAWGVGRGSVLTDGGVVGPGKNSSPSASSWEVILVLAHRGHRLQPAWRLCRQEHEGSRLVLASWVT